MIWKTYIIGATKLKKINLGAVVLTRNGSFNLGDIEAAEGTQSFILSFTTDNEEEGE